MKTCPLFFNAHVQNTPSIRHFWRHTDAIWQVSPALLTFRRHLPVTKDDVLLTFCTYKVLYAKKAGGKNCRGNLLGGVLMATMRCARRHARGHQQQRCRHGVGLLVDYLFCDTDKQVENTRRSRVFLTSLSVFRNQRMNTFECLNLFLKLNHIQIENRD